MLLPFRHYPDGWTVGANIGAPSQPGLARAPVVDIVSLPRCFAPAQTAHAWQAYAVHWEDHVSGWLTLADLAAALQTDVLRAKQTISDRELLATRREVTSGERVLVVPADFVADGAVVKHLAGTINLLADAGFTDAEAMAWLFTPLADLAATPIALLRADRSREVKRRAQASAW